MTLEHTIAAIPGVVMLRPQLTKHYTIYPFTYRNLSFYCYSIDGLGFIGINGHEITVLNPATDLEALAISASDNRI